MSEVEQGQASEAKAKKEPKYTLAAGKTDEGKLHVTVGMGENSHRFEFDHSHPLYEHFAVHGVGKKVRDTLATIKDDSKREQAVKDLFGAFQEGKWNAHRTGDGSSSVGVLARALSALYGKSIEESQAFVAKLSKKQQSDMRRVKPVADKIAELQAGEGNSDEAESLLGQFAGEATE